MLVMFVPGVQRETIPVSKSFRTRFRDLSFAEYLSCTIGL
jgi:hypothetical protein